MQAKQRKSGSKHPSSWDLTLRQALAEAGDLPPEARERLREDLRLQFDYPGEYVAYLDSWKTQRQTRRLLRRVIAHSLSLKDLYEALAALSPKERANVVLHYAVDPHQQELEVHYDLPGR